MVARLDRDATRGQAVMQPSTKESRGEPLSLPPAHAAEDLTGGGNQAWIEHLGQIYVLRITRAGKLILTK